LKPGAMTVHPMAFSFLRRDANELFFPTVHIHDGTVHPKADFDHTLYCQPHHDHHLALGRTWQESAGPASGFMQVDKTKGVIEADQHCYQRQLHANCPIAIRFSKSVDSYLSGLRGRLKAGRTANKR